MINGTAKCLCDNRAYPTLDPVYESDPFFSLPDVAPETVGAVGVIGGLAITAWAIFSPDPVGETAAISYWASYFMQFAK